MNYRSSISFHGKRLRWCPQTWHRCRNQPTRREDLAQDVLMYPEPSLTGAQGNLCCSPSCLWPPRTFLSHSAPHPCQPRGPGVAVLSCTPFPSSPLKSARGFLFFAADFSEKWNGALCMKGWIKDNIWAVHSVLTGEIPAHGDTSLLTPPICIFLPLGNSGGQIKQVCSGLGERKNPKPPFLCI